MIKEISTVLSTALIKRQSYQSPITEAELENTVVEAIWKVFDRARLQIASKSDISEFDLILRDARVIGFKVDRHKVLNPEGFAGKTIEVLAFVTIVKKGFNLFKGAHAFEEGTLRAYRESAKSQTESLFYVEAKDSKTTIFIATPEKASRISEINWGKTDILNAIADFFHIDRETETAEKIYKRFVNEEFSPLLFAQLENIFRSSFRNFIEGLSETSKKVENVFIDAFALPESLYSRKFLFNGKRAKIIRADKSEDIAEFLEERTRAYARYNDLVKTRIKWMAN